MYGDVIISLTIKHVWNVDYQSTDGIVVGFHAEQIVACFHLLADTFLIVQSESQLAVWAWTIIIRACNILHDVALRTILMINGELNKR